MMEMMLESYTLDLIFTWLKNMEHLEKEVESKILFSFPLVSAEIFVRKRVCEFGIYRGSCKVCNDVKHLGYGLRSLGVILVR